jgi:ribosomal protein S18 acetylase RimI-like enzyme
MDQHHSGPESSEVASLKVEDEPDLRDLAFLEKRLYEYSAGRTGVGGGRWLTIFRRDHRGAIVAGLHGWTWGDCFHVQTLWVREDLRHQGWGTRLLRAPETEATARGCRRVLLSTLDYQAPSFYQKLGYRVVGHGEGYPGAHTTIYLRRDLGPTMREHGE